MEKEGFQIRSTAVPEEILDELRAALFSGKTAGERCLLDHPLVCYVALSLKQELAASGGLPALAVAVQAIAFDKTPATNWKVAWHQDLMFPFAKPVTAEDYGLPCIKKGVAYARPPLSVLEDLLAVRLHLDDCDSTHGPLRVSPGTHRKGIISTTDIPDVLANHPQVTCEVKKGEALLMRPLLLHASSQATEPKHRRVLHLVYHSGTPIAEPWHRSL